MFDPIELLFFNYLFDGGVVNGLITACWLANTAAMMRKLLFLFMNFKIPTIIFSQLTIYVRGWIHWSRHIANTHMSVMMRMNVSKRRKRLIKLKLNLKCC